VRATCGITPVPDRNGWHDGNTRIFMFGIPCPKCILTHSFQDGRPADVVIDISGQSFAAFKCQVGVVTPGTVEFQVLVDGRLKQKTPVLTSDDLREISVDVTGAREVTLRVLDGGDGYENDSALWGFPRFIEPGTEDPLEAPPAELRLAVEANAAFFLAEVHWRLDRKDLAGRWFDKAVAWIDRNPAEAEKLRPLRAEAAQLLEIREKPLTAKEKPQTK
jgi:hypothetical protein